MARTRDFNLTDSERTCGGQLVTHPYLVETQEERRIHGNLSVVTGAKDHCLEHPPRQLGRVALTNGINGAGGAT